MFKYWIPSFFLVVQLSCTCSEPDSEYVTNDFKKSFPNHELMSIKNIENSPPCFYWKVRYKKRNDSVRQEVWQYCDNDKKCWDRKVMSDSSTQNY